MAIVMNFKKIIYEVIAEVGVQNLSTEFIKGLHYTDLMGIERFINGKEMDDVLDSGQWKNLHDSHIQIDINAINMAVASAITRFSMNLEDFVSNMIYDDTRDLEEPSEEE